ncbi:M20/M25/M40 family metallo-hydrolase [Clostridium felsineum]|uniref:M20/M25/M40 family metallo-hydrolase n=1 Tax=Clostridium felsineum TaxID=36839 RepID=UPI00214DA2F0|nr:M20/M25/M40 family metallo-hydrolase [Clostridium felsineum]MCR3761209.1 M20/M25/M40 family metallo-hydrolase [Clostridium felsineum]
MSKISEEIENLTIELVKVPSVNGTEGEGHIGNKMLSYLKEIEYFKEHQGYAFRVPLKNDKLSRGNIFALLRGEAGQSNKTIILHGHMDTVAVEDYGALKEYAFDPKILKEKLKEIDLDEDVRRDLESGDWMFGRGASDMKSGDAVHLVVLKELSKRVKEISGNILFMSTPVEENEHNGIIESLDVLEELKRKYNLEYTLAINNDYICPMYKGDNTRYLYTGTVGKLLPAFYFVGKETHVGQCFEGINADAIASEVIREIDLNIELCDEYKGEYTLPPSVLKFKDLKESYNVQTPFSSYAYFNYTVHGESPKEAAEKLKKAAERAFERVIKRNDDRYKKYCEMTNQKYESLNFEAKVITYTQLYTMAKARFHGDLGKELESYEQKLVDNRVDIREISLKVVDKVFNIYGEKKPCIVMFFAPPYCPHNTLNADNEKENEIIDKIKESAEEIKKQGINEEFKVMQFFPSLSDSSYLRIDDDDEGIESLTSNFPGWDKVYKVPVNKIKKLNIPAVNYGCYGKDAHKWTERVYKPYSFEVLPKLIITTIEKFL